MNTKHTRRGFTLIELLVVALIISILAAVAIPQYKKAVVKARVATILPVLQNMRQAQDAYYLANGSYAENMPDLDIQWPNDCTFEEGGFNGGPCGTYFRLSTKSGFSSENYSAQADYCPNHNIKWEDCADKRDFAIKYLYAHAKDYPNQRYCFVPNSSALGESICKSLSGKSAPDIDTAYFF